MNDTDYSTWIGQPAVGQRQFAPEAIARIAQWSPTGAEALRQYPAVQGTIIAVALASADDPVTWVTLRDAAGDLHDFCIEEITLSPAAVLEPCR